MSRTQKPGSASLADRLNLAMDGLGLPKRGRGAFLARTAGVSSPTVNGWMSGKHGADPGHLAVIAKALRVDPGWLAFGTRSAQSKSRLERLEVVADRLSDGDIDLLVEIAWRFVSAGRPKA